MLKYGKVALAEGLSGSSGQVAAPHAVMPDAVPSPGVAPISGPTLPPASPLAAAVIGTGRRRGPRVIAASSTVEPETDGR
jgi:hypothetical protein